MMWFQTLKTKQTIRSICTQNGQGQVAGLEYTDKKSEVHALKVSMSVKLVLVERANVRIFHRLHYREKFRP